ncbi:MAG: carboxyl transferase domain-containing protein [Acidimicrobiales bacterium]
MSASKTSRPARSRPAPRFGAVDPAPARPGKMLARERIEHLLDEGSFHELDMLARHRSPDVGDRPYTDGVITGWGTVDGRKVFVFSQDFTLFGGALGEVFAEKIHKVMDMALKVQARRWSASTTAPVPASRKARCRSPPTAASSTATCSPRA